MSLKRTVLLAVAVWLPLVSLLHAWVNLDLFRGAQQTQRTFKVGFLPVT